MNSLYAWICIFSPFVGTAVTPLLAMISPKIRDPGAVFFSMISALSALCLLPALLHPVDLPVETVIPWLTVPVPINAGILIDPLSIILANVVAVISFFIMVYCLGYMKGDAALSRFWMWMNSFIGSMLLLVLSNNLLFIFVGWKLVGVCSYGLIGFYYQDQKQYWIGGPPPAAFVTPSQAGLKALVMTGIGDLLMLGGILIIFFYSGTLNLLKLYQTSPDWLPVMAQSPGMVVLVTILILAGPIGKSAQFPLHEWLPEAMAGPGPVSALIHAATMVKSGVYLVARFVPVFYYGYWVADCQAASLFFVITAWVGVITAFLAATQGMVTLELKKALAYSTVSQIGYMMLALGVSGLSSSALVGGYTSGVFHLISHALFKACLFLCAGSVIHTAHSIYMNDMGSMRKFMPYTWIFMMVAALSLMGLPPLPGFWSKDAVLISTLDTSLPLFTVAMITVMLTAFYTTRMMGMVFYGPESQNIREQRQKKSRLGDVLPVMWIPCGIVTVMIGLMGLFGLQAEHLIQERIQATLVVQLKLPVSETLQRHSPLLVPILSVISVLAGAVPAYLIYVSGKVSPGAILDRLTFARMFQRFFRERWYIDSFYNRFIVGGLLAVSQRIATMETLLNVVIHRQLPNLLTGNAYAFVKQLRTENRELAINIAYVLLFFIAFVSLLFMV